MGKKKVKTKGKERTNSVRELEPSGGGNHRRKFHTTGAKGGAKGENRV